MKKELIVDPSCYSSMYRIDIKTARISRPHKYANGIFKVFLNIAGEVREYVFKKLRYAADARKILVSKIAGYGYKVIQ